MNYRKEYHFTTNISPAEYFVYMSEQTYEIYRMVSECEKQILLEVGYQKFYCGQNWILIDSVTSIEAAEEIIQELFKKIESLEYKAFGGGKKNEIHCHERN